MVVNFTDGSGGNPTSWLWDFGNGATSTLRNPSTTYFNPGTYTVTLTVTNAQGSNTMTRTNLITVYGKPAVNFIVDDSIGCFPHRAQFSDLSTASANTTNTTWLWDFGDGTQSTDRNPMHVYNNMGNFTVTLKVTNDKGCSGVFTKSTYIRLPAGIVSSFTNAQPTVCRVPLNISFTNSSTGPGTLSSFWDFGDGTTSTAANPTHTYTTPGNYTVRLATTSSNGCSDTLIKTSTVVIPNINSSFSAPDSICVDAVTSFQNSSTPAPQSWSWVFGDGTSSTDSTPLKSFSVPGNYEVKLYNTYAGCSDSAIKTIRVLPKPVAAFTSDQRGRCQPDLTVNFQNQSTGAASWIWNFGDGATSTAQNPSHTYTSYGNFTVTLVAFTASGCTDTLRIPDYITVQKPAISFQNLPVEACIPLNLSPIPTIVTPDAVTSYQWNFGDGTTSTSPSPSHTYAVQGNFTVSLTVTTSTGCTETYSLTNAVRVGERPVVSFSAQPLEACAFQDVQFTDLSDKADKWEWLFGDGSTSFEQNPRHQYSDTGLMTVKLIVTNNGCVDSAKIVDYIKIKPPISNFGYLTDCSNRFRFAFTDSSIGADTWFWEFGDGNTSSQREPVHFYTAFQTYTVRLTVTKDGCSHTFSRPLKVMW